MNLFKKKCVLLLGASTDQLYIIKTANELGIETAVLDGNPDAPGLKLATYSAPINFSDIPRVIEFVKGLKNKGINICGVTTMGSDVPHFVSKIAKHFNWIGPSEDTARIATNKYEMKCRYLEKGIPIPKFSLVNSPENVLSKWQEWGCSKVIIKPTDRAGSRGVSLIQSPKDIENAYKNAQENSNNGQILLEEYIEGPQISTESILTKEKCVTPGFADREYDNMQVFWPQIMENGGWVPSSLSMEIQDKINQLVERSARALGIESGVAKGDVVLSPEKGPMMIEMAARLSGGDFCESLVPLSAGVNYVEAAINIALGNEVNFEKLRPTQNYWIANRYFFPKPGKLEEISGIDEVKAMLEIEKLEFFYNIGDIIPIIKNHGQRAGVFVIKANNKIEALGLIDKIYEKIRFKIDGDYFSGNPRNYNYERS